MDGNEPQLLNALRGTSQPVELTVNRKGKNMTVLSNIKKSENILARRAIYFSGVAINELRDNEWRQILGGDAFRISFVEPGDLADSVGISSDDMIVEINGKKVESLDQIYKILSDLGSSQQKVLLRLKRASFEKEHFFSYRDRKIAVQNIKWITFENKPVIPAAQTLADVK